MEDPFDMHKKLQTAFSTRQYMLSKDYEIYYYSDSRKDGMLSRVQLHSHDYYEFYFFLEGNVSIRINEKEYPLNPGDMILLPPGIPHLAMIHDTAVPYRRFVFWVSRTYLQRLCEDSPDYGYLPQLAQTRGHYLFHYDTISFNALQSRIFQLLEEIHAERFGKAARVSLCAQELILHLNRTVYEKEHPDSPEETQDLCRNLLQYIETHLDEDLSLDALARKFYVSKYHIAHMFKENFGISVHQFIMKKRLSMCRDSILSRQEISKAYLLFGFKDYSSFYRAFIKEYGMSPKEYQDYFRQDGAPLATSPIRKDSAEHE